MAYHYQKEGDKDNSRSLPNIETFYLDDKEKREALKSDDLMEKGWYYWYCLPGCMPDSEAIGPFETEEEALEDARYENDL